MRKILSLILALSLLATSYASAEESAVFKQFKNNYKALNAEILKYVSEVAEVDNFVYQKDLATFTFKKGKIYLIRHVLDRPTAAIFIGEGNCQMEMPSDLERRSLFWCSGDSVVNEDFKSCFMRLGDNFDLQLKAQFATTDHKLKWKEFNVYKKNQSEVFFRPVTMHEYDNYFQLLRSAYNREDDGYFWIDFNRYVYRYDPSCPESSVLAYEFQGGDFDITECAVTQKKARDNYDNFSLSDQIFPSRILSQKAKFNMAGATGEKIKEAEVNLSLVTNLDSTQFISLFLHHNLNLDSIYLGGERCDYWRRRDFSFVGLILPEMQRAGDTLNFTLWYHGGDYASPLPMVKNPAPSEIVIDFTVTQDFVYFLPGHQGRQEVDGRHYKFVASPEELYRYFQFQAVTDVFDTLAKVSSAGIPVTILKDEDLYKNDCFTPDDLYDPAVMNAINFMTARLGPLPGAEEIVVYLDSNLSMPGLMELRQVACYDNLVADLEANAGYEAARQYFGALMKPATDREFWYSEALPNYLSMMFVQEATSPSMLYSQLTMRKQVIELFGEKNYDVPLGAGQRCPTDLCNAKGAWLMHMLRFLMFDPAKPTELTFLRFVRDFANRSIASSFTNRDFIQLAEKHSGQALELFFDQWLFDFGFPEYSVEWSSQKREDGYYLLADITTKKVRSDFEAPVWMRIVSVDGQSNFFHPTLKGLSQNLELGPVEGEPDKFFFNEFFSVLAKVKLDKK